MSGFFINQFIQLMADRKGYSLLHSSGVSIKDNAYLFVGKTGAGKTTIATNLLHRVKEYKFLGDDYVFVENNVALPYITPFGFFNYNIYDFLGESVDRKSLLLFILKKLLFKATFGYSKFKIKLSKNWFLSKRISEPKEVDKLFVLSTKTKKELEVTKIKKEKAIKHISTNLQSEFPITSKYFAKYGSIYPNERISINWEIYEKQLRKNLSSKTKFYRLNLPIKEKKEKFEVIEDLINN